MNDEKKAHDKEEQKPKFKIVDRRRLSSEDEEPEEETAPLKETPPKADAKKEEKSDKAKEPAPDEGKMDTEPDALGYSNVVLSLLQTITSVVWVHLGLVPNPQTNIVLKKLEQARKLIGLYEHLYELSKDEFPIEVRKELERLAQDMKANYVNQL